MNISLPENITVIDRNAPDSAEYFKLFGLDYDTVMSQMNANNVYLQGMDNTASLTVTVSMTESADSQELENYNLLSSEQLGEIARNFLSQPEYTACRIDEAGKEVTWLSFDTSVSGVKGCLANTVYGGRSINLSVQRTGADVTDADSELFAAAVASVSFGKQGFFQKYWLCLAIAAGALLVILVLLILIIRTVSSLKTKKKAEKENDKILEELSDKYSRRTVSADGDGNPAATKIIPVQTEDGGSAETEQPQTEVQAENQPAAAENPDPDEPRSKFTDEQLAAILGEDISMIRPPEEESEEVKEYIRPDKSAEPKEDAQEQPDADEAAEAQTRDADAKAEEAPEAAEDDEDDFFAGVNFTDETESPAETEITETAAEVLEAPRPEPIEQPVEEAPDAPVQAEQPGENAPDAPVQAEQPGEVPEVVREYVRTKKTAAQPVDEAATEQAFEEAAQQAQPASDPGGEAEVPEAEEQSDDGELDELDEYMNDEVLVRENARANKFRDSNDFFEEAPRKSMGVLSSRDIEDAEEYDVIGEEEKRAEEVKRDVPVKKKKEKKKKKSKGGFKRFALGFLSGAKYFFVHCGYFITNVARAIKRKHRIRKRKKAEEERRRRARERAAKQRAMAAQREREQRENGGLVQVHSRSDRRPQQGQRRPSGSQQRRPANGQRRPSDSAPRKPRQKRRPSGSAPRKPQQKRRPPERR